MLKKELEQKRVADKKDLNKSDKKQIKQKKQNVKEMNRPRLFSRDVNMLPFSSSPKSY